jgi:hypothetical protein
VGPLQAPYVRTVAEGLSQQRSVPLPPVGVTPTHQLADAPEGRNWRERIALDAFAPGDYELRVVATDPATGRKVERRVGFRVEL